VPPRIHFFIMLPPPMLMDIVLPDPPPYMTPRTVLPDPPSCMPPNVVLSDPTSNITSGPSKQMIVISDSMTESASNQLNGEFITNNVNNNPSHVRETEIICPICLESMDEEKGNLFTVTRCSHTYHKHCIKR